MAEERLQKILAQAGFGSRRSCEEIIQAKRVMVNGVLAKIGDKADAATDKILVDLKPIPKKPAPVYIALHKPRSVLSAIHQNDARSDVLTYVPADLNLFPVGRLDYDSEGLILLTNDGDFANELTHPSYGHEKEYIVQVGARPDPEQLTTWRRGVVLEDGYKTAPCSVEVIESAPRGATLRIVMREGRKRQIREVGSRIGLPVLKIKRVRIGSLRLGTLKAGEWRFLTEAEVRDVRRKAQPARRRTTQTSIPRHSASSTGGIRDVKPTRPEGNSVGTTRKSNPSSKQGTAKPPARTSYKKKTDRS